MKYTMMASAAFLAQALVVSSSPLSTLATRAGAPIAQPIPANCTVTDAHYSAKSSCGRNFKPTSEVLSSSLIYTYNLDPSTYQVTSKTHGELYKQCLETCYGYGYPGISCLGAYNAFDVPSSTSSTGLTYRCQLFSRALKHKDFETADEGKYTESRYGDITCPQSYSTIS